MRVPLAIVVVGVCVVVDVTHSSVTWNKENNMIRLAVCAYYEGNYTKNILKKYILHPKIFEQNN